MRQLFQQTFSSPLGNMLALADAHAVHFLGFHDQKYVETQLVSLCEDATVTQASNPILQQVQEELAAYFAGNLKHFKTPVTFEGTPFQAQVWQELQKMSFGKLCAYQDLANAVQRPRAVRAVGTAVGKNPLTILVPCHRILQRNGLLGGYAGGMHRKEWLLNHEKKMAA